MKRKCLSGMLALLLSLSACGAADKEVPISEPETIADDDRIADEPADDSNTQAEGGGSKEQIRTQDIYQDIYYQAVADSAGESRVYALVYLDDDDIPELVIVDREFDFYSVYTVKDGALFCMVDSLAAVEMVYYERTGVFYEFWRFNGGGDEGDYARFFFKVSTDGTITEETPCLMQEEYHALYTQDGAPTGNGDYMYWYQKEIVDGETYQELLSGLGVTEDGGRLFTENAVGKEEMLELLSR